VAQVEVVRGALSGRGGRRCEEVELRHVGLHPVDRRARHAEILGDGPEAVALWAAFTTTGNKFIDVRQQVVLATAHRYEKFNGGSSYCVQSKQASDTGGVTINSTATQLRLTLETRNPLVSGDPAIHAVVDITVNNRTLTFSYQTTFFPSIGFRLTRGGVLDTDIVNDVDCLSQGDVLGGSGVANIARGLLNFNNKGTLIVASNSGTASIDHQDAILC
jgi:hypothetical protein